MADPFVAEIRVFAGNFAPVGWAMCDGQLLPISQNTALFSLVGTYYGGDGKSTFALPDLKGRAPMHTGNGPGLSPRDLGQNGGAEAVALTPAQLPSHSHGVMGSLAPASSTSLEGGMLAVAKEDTYLPRGSRSMVSMSPEALGPAGGNAAHNNMQPFLVLVFIIALQGVYPSRP